MDTKDELPVFYQDIDATKDEAPKDKFNLVYLIFLLQGTGVLFPWNAFISAPDYFSALYFPNTMLYFSVAYSVPNLLGLLFMIKFGSKLSLRMKMIPAYVLTFFILILVPILGFAGVNGIVGFSITIVLIILAALCTSLLQGGIFGFAGVLPPNYTQAVMSGNGIAGVACSFLRIVTKLTIEQNRKHVPIQTMTISAAVYFFVCALVIIACIVSFFIIMRTPFVQHYLQKSTEPTTSINDQQQTYDEVSTLVPANAPQKAGILTVFRKIWIQACLVMTVFWMTLSVFPGLSVSVPTYYTGTVMKDWLPILIGASFNIFDFIGRSAPRWIVMFNRKWVAIPIFVRLLLVPLFVFMYKPAFVGLDAFNDAVPLLAISVVALTNGYLSSLCMMYGPSLVDDHEKQTAGTIMTFFLLLGICLGSNTGLVIGQAIPADVHPYVE